jgi:2'-5' RNA ligase
VPGTRHIRYFIALPLAAPRPVERLIDQLADFTPHLKPVDPQHLHLTVRFLGPASETRLPAFIHALDAAIAAVNPTPITLHWQRPRFFPTQTPRQARTVVLPPDDTAQTQTLHALEAALSDALQQLDPPIEPEARGFHPHLTLARIKQPRGKGKGKTKGRAPLEAVETLLNRYAHTPFTPSTLDRLVLFRSTLTPQGPHYEPLHQAAFSP